MKLPFQSGAGAKKDGDDSRDLPPGGYFELVDPPRDHAVNVAEDMLKVLPSGGFRVRVWIEFDGKELETEIEIEQRKGDAT